MESKTLTLKDGRILKIMYDGDAQHPFEDDDVLNMTIATWHPRYKIGNEQLARPNDRIEYLLAILHLVRNTARGETLSYYAQKKYEALEDAKCDAADIEMWLDTVAIIRPIYAYEHSGITISLNPFGDRWDSGQVGFALYLKEQVLADKGNKRFTKACETFASRQMECVVDIIDSYLLGEVFGYTLQEGGDITDSCWGFYGADHMKSGLLQSALSKEDIQYLVKTKQITVGGCYEKEAYTTILSHAGIHGSWDVGRR